MPYSPVFTANPTGADLIAFFGALWKTAYSGFETGYVSAAIDRFESITGRLPMLAISSTTLYFDPPTPDSGHPNWRNGVLMDLDFPFTAITRVATDCSPTNSTGTTLTIGTDVLLEPNNYALKRLPIESLKFLAGFSSSSRSIGVTGTPGSYAAWPPDAWFGVLACAAANFAADVLSGAIGAGMASYKEADVSEDYGEAAFGANVDMWKVRETAAILRYTRITA